MFRCVPQPWFLQRGCGFLFVRRNDRMVFLWLCVFNFVALVRELVAPAVQRFARCAGGDCT